MQRRLFCAIVSFLAVGGSTIAAAAADAVVTRGPYLQLATPSSMTIVWRTDAATTPVVRYGRSPDKLDQACDGAAVTVRDGRTPAGDADDAKSRPLPLHSAPDGTVQYEARLDGLAVDTQYYYAVYDGDARLAGGDADHFFRTHPPAGPAKPFRFWIVGDSGTGDSNQKAVFQAMRDHTARAGKPVDLYLHVGDMAYPKGTDAEFQRNFFDIYQPLLCNTVCWAAMGNHEGHTSKGLTGVGPYYDAYVCPQRGEAGGLPSAAEAYYSFDYANVHFICLDSHDLDTSETGVMATWLKADLDRTTADWIVGFWHHPPYTKGSHDSDKEGQLVAMRTRIMPILEAGGVDVVLTGHSHIYERSMLVDGAYSTPTTADGVILDDGDGDPNGDGAYRKSAGLHPHQGTVQIVTGNGGASVRRVGTMPIMKRIVVEHGSTILDVDGDVLTGIMVNRDGAERDLFQIVKRGTVTPQIVKAPRVPPPYAPTVKKPSAEPAKAAGVPDGAVPLVAKHAEWEYLAGKHPPSNWADVAFIPEAADGWKQGAAGFGYGDGDDATVLADMQNRYTTVYARTEFELNPGDKEQIAELGLVINYDDAFIAYLNGREIARANVKRGSGPQASDVSSHEAKGYQYFSLRDALPFLTDDDNIIAVEGHNNGVSSSDFSLDPYVVAVKRPSSKE